MFYLLLSVFTLQQNEKFEQASAGMAGVIIVLASKEREPQCGVNRRRNGQKILVIGFLFYPLGAEP